MAAHADRMPFSLDPLMAEAKRRMRKRRVLVAILALLITGGAAGAAVALTASSGFRAAAICTGGGASVYEVPSHPAQTPSAPAWPPGNDDWGWMFRSHPLTVGDQLRINGSQWQVTAIAALPHACQPFLNQGFTPPNSGSLAGRLILRPAG